MGGSILTEAGRFFGFGGGFFPGESGGLLESVPPPRERKERFVVGVVVGGVVVVVNVVVVVAGASPPGLGGVPLRSVMGKKREPERELGWCWCCLVFLGVARCCLVLFVVGEVARLRLSSKVIAGTNLRQRVLLF